VNLAEELKLIEVKLSAVKQSGHGEVVVKVHQGKVIEVIQTEKVLVK